MEFNYECVECGKTFEGNKSLYVCDDCSEHQKPGGETRGVLKIKYNTKNKKTVENIFKDKSGKRNIYRYLDILPIENPIHISKLDVGNSAIYEFGSQELYIFDDTRNPSCSYKDRASILVAAKALDFKKHDIIAASTGNAASSMACISASISKLRCILCVPEKAPQAKITQMQMFGATVVKVKGSYDDAFELSLKLSEAFEYYNRNTAFNPFTIEGKKTAALEMFDHFGRNLPDYIFVSVGDGCIISGIYKGFEDLKEFGLIEKIPVIVSCQAQGSSVINKAVKSGKIVQDNNASTVADSILVCAPRNSVMAVKYIREYNGKTVDVTDCEILNSIQKLASSTGVFAEPAGACAYAGFLKFKSEGKLKDKRSLCVITGNGLKDIISAQKTTNIIDSIRPTVMEYEKNFKI
ncbi:MAG: threonine synthase [Candidatus Muirbacterium halophilum]|nr:threonine synthase [Candidatus Muirbacterium halophilum]MCK9476842.1 threonine synthase [Candidatus Muirbacterium halophilum]